jgi:hypothetical protein
MSTHEVDYYDVQNMIRDARSEIRGEIQDAICELRDTLRVELQRRGGKRFAAARVIAGCAAVKLVEFDLRPSTAEGRTLLWVLIDGRRAAFTTLRNDDAEAFRTALEVGEYQFVGEQFV